MSTAGAPLPLAWEELRRFVNDEPGYEGTPGVRSVEYPCDAFDGRGYDGTGACMSDGHYLCTECSLLAPEAPRFTEPGRGIRGRPYSAIAPGRLDRIHVRQATMRHREALHHRLINPT